MQHRELELALLALLTDLLRPLALLRRRALRILGEDGLEARRLLQPLLLGAPRGGDPGDALRLEAVEQLFAPRGDGSLAPLRDLRLHLGSLEPRQHLRHHALAQIALAYPPAQIHVDLAVHLLVQLAQPPLLALALLLLPPILAQHVAPLALANSLLLLRDEAETHAVAGLA